MWHLLKKKKNYFRQIDPFRGTILTFLSLFIQYAILCWYLLVFSPFRMYKVTNPKNVGGLIFNENHLQHRRKKCVCGLYRGFREWRSSDGRSLRRINSTPLSPFFFVTNENGQKENVERKCGIGNGDFQVGFNLSLSGGGEIGDVQIRIQPTRPTGRCRCPNYLEWGWGGRWWWQW